MNPEEPKSADSMLTPAPYLSQDTTSDLLQHGVVGASPRPGLMGALDNYEIIRLIGAGGMGLVFLARETGAANEVALKVLKPELAVQPRAVHRFLVEARHMQRLSHPGIVQVLEVREREQGPYFVMPYMAGGSLAARIKPGEPLDEGLVLRIARDVAEALSHAHEHGITHRDIKPANILLDDAGAAHLTDFGLGRTVYNDSIVDGAHVHFEGTPSYAAPEVAGGGAGDTRCDTYSFGAALYEMLTGHPPYDGAGSQEILAQIKADPPVEIDRRNPRVSAGMVKIVEGAMARQLRDRYASMADVVADLRRLEEGQEPVGPRGQSTGHGQLVRRASREPGQPASSRSARMPEETPLEHAVEFAENPEPRCPCVLLLDTSGSMQGRAIDALNEGLRVYRDDLLDDQLASRRVEVAVIAFDTQVRVVQDFVTADQFTCPTLTAQGMTCMGTAIHRALDMIQTRKSQYKQNGVSYYRPWVFMITDGEPQGESEDLVQRAAMRIREDEAARRVCFFAVGVESANMERLRQIVVRTPVKLVGLNFVEMFVWLSRSTQAVSHSKTNGDQVALPPAGWATT